MLLRLFHNALILILTLATVSACSPGNSTPVLAVDSKASLAPEDSSVSVVPAECVEFQKFVDATYNFKPSKLTAEQQTAKSAEMDAIWNKVKADQKKLVPCLIAALESPNANNFFRFDGSTLLFSLDQSEPTKKLVIRSYAQTDLEDVMLQYWIRPLLRFGLEGLDTSDAGHAWLAAKDPGYYLPQHGTLKVNRTVGALAIYGSMDEKFATPALLRVASSKDHPARELAASLLLKQVTPEAFAALAKMDSAGLTESTRVSIKKTLEKPSFIEKRVGEPKISRTEYVKAFQELSEGRSQTFMELVDRVPDGEKDAVAVLLSEDIPLVRKARRFFASTGTPHIPEWYQSFTDILMVMVWKPEFAKKLTAD